MAKLVKPKILVVGGYQDESEPFYSLLAKSFELLLVKNPENALDILKLTPDISMTIIALEDYASLLSLIYNSFPHHDMPMIVLAPFDSPESVLSALDNGAYDVWMYPIPPEVVFLKTKNILIHEPEIDELTGLYTKKAFLRRTEALLLANPGRRFTIGRFGIDDFSEYVAAAGFSSSEELLRSIGQECLSRQALNTVFAYYDNNTFAFCVPSELISARDIVKIAIGKWESSAPGIQVPLHMGLYEISDRSMPISEMCENALLALNSVQGNINKWVCYYQDELREAVEEERRIIESMDHALETGQFQIYLQPQYNQVSGMLYGAEALIRWIHPEKGILSPGKFIPIFERNGFITKLDAYVFEQVCLCQRRWLDEGISVVPVSVNLSRRDIESEELFENIVKLLKKYNLPPQYVNVEITESAYMSNQKRMTELVQKLKDHGVEVEMDDFGSGYSSLNTLQDIEVDLLKLDVGFLKKSKESEKSGRILSSVIRMAHWLHIPVIAEGVETVEQAEFLKSLGCIYVQGYLFGKPMPAKDYKNVLLAGKIDILRNERIRHGEESHLQFLSESSAAAALMDEFIGAAGLIAFDGDNAEGIRFNDRFFKLVEATSSEYMEYQLSLKDRFDEENWTLYKNAMLSAIATKGESECVAKSKPAGRRKAHKWTRTRFKYLSSSDGVAILYVIVEDLGAEKEQEEALKNLRSDIEALTESISGGIMRLKYDGDKLRVLRANEVASAMFGFAHSEYMSIAGRDAFSCICPEDLADIRSEILQIVERQGRYFEKEFRHICKDGSYKWVRITCQLLPQENGALFAVGLITDLDKIGRKQEDVLSLKRQLAAMLARETGIYSQLPQGVVEISEQEDGSFRVELISEHLWGLLGYETKEGCVLGIRDWEAFSAHFYPEDREKLKALFREAASAELHAKPLVTKLRMIQYMDAPMEAFMSFQRTLGLDGRPVVRCMILDMGRLNTATETYALEGKGTPLTAAEETILLQKAKLRELSRLNGVAMGMFAGIAVLDATPDGSIYPVHISRKIGKMLGYKPEEYELRPLNMPLVLFGEDAVFTKDRLAELASASLAGKNDERIHQMRCKDGGIVYAKLCVHAVREESGHYTLTVGVVNCTKEYLAQQSALDIAAYQEKALGALGGCTFKYAASDYKLYDVSREFVAALGYAPSEFNAKFGQDYFELICAKDREAIRSELEEKALGAKAHKAHEYRIETATGELVWFRETGTLITDRGGKRWYFATLRNIQEERHVVEELNALKQLEAVLNSVADCGMAKLRITGKRHSLVSISGNIEEELGFSKEELGELLELDMALPVIQEERAIAREQVLRTVETGEAIVSEHRLLKKHGGYLWYKFQSMYDGAAGDGYLYLFFINISARKYLENKCSEGEKKIEALISAIPGGVASFEMRYSGLHLLGVSDGILRHNGFTEKEYAARMEGRRGLGIGGPDEALVEKAISDMIKTGQPIDMRYRARNKDGEVVWLAMRAALTAPMHGNPTFICVMKRVESGDPK